MAAVRERKRQRLGDKGVTLEGRNPLSTTQSLAGVRVYDVGQGDAIAVLNGDLRPVLQIDYGGRQGNPFTDLDRDEVDSYLPVPPNALVMMTHWDEDHWCTAPKGGAVMAAEWLVPRQVTSPRAVRFAATLDRISCIPESQVGRAQSFTTASGDEVWWEKIGASEVDATRFEDCNRTGVALSVVRQDRDGPDRVILMPGDAAFGNVGHYREHYMAGRLLAGIVAFHHGAGTHWTETTEALVADWPTVDGGASLIFSCAKPNSYDHPNRALYERLLAGRLRNVTETSDLRLSDRSFYDLLF